MCAGAPCAHHHHHHDHDDDDDNNTTVQATGTHLCTVAMFQPVGVAGSFVLQVVGEVRDGELPHRRDMRWASKLQSPKEVHSDPVLWWEIYLT